MGCYLEERISLSSSSLRPLLTGLHVVSNSALPGASAMHFSLGAGQTETTKTMNPNKPLRLYGGEFDIVSQ